MSIEPADCGSLPELLMGDAEAALTRVSVRWTDMRAHIFETLAAFGRAASAYEVADRLSLRMGRRVAANTVYRILDLFVATDLAIRVEVSNAYLANQRPGCPPCGLLLVCQTCGSASHLDYERVSADVEVLARAVGFDRRKTLVEVGGTCGSCKPNFGAASPVTRVQA